MTAKSWLVCSLTVPHLVIENLYLRAVNAWLRYRIQKGW